MSVLEGASKQAHNLVQMRVHSNAGSPTTPLTPVALAMPTTPHTCIQDECVLEDLQLAAELGKTLLERNRELEHTVKQNQTVIDDQVQEIEYLNKQTTALKEVNDSRLRIYEQLEISIQELEKNNQRLGAENSADKRKIKSLTTTVESLESKVEELQKQLDESKYENDHRGRNRKKSIIADDALLRRSISCENHPKMEYEPLNDDVLIKNYILEIEGKLKDSQEKLAAETKKREELEIELACMTQANGVFQEQLSILREKQMNLQSFEDELASLDDDSSARLCSKCMGSVAETGSNATIYDLNDIEDTDMAIESSHGECALVKLKNGGYAWGSQESLASMGRVLSHGGSNNTSPRTDVGDAPHNSLLFELDTQYRILIEKYEALLAAREQQQLLHQETYAAKETVVDSGPKSILVADTSQTETVVQCEKCANCSCGQSRPKSNLEELSETETSSSGFSEGENKYTCKHTQTEEDEEYDQFDEAKTPTPALANKCLDLASPLNPCDKRFSATPEYKKLFQEIFTVLKKNVDENTDKKAAMMSKENPEQIMNVPNKTDCVSTNAPLVEISNTLSTQKCGNEQLSLSKSDESDTNCDKKVSPKDESCEQKENISDSSDSKSPNNSNPDSSQPLAYNKPLRPDSLDLISNSSRSSSKSRRKRRNQRRRMENQQNQAQVQPSQSQEIFDSRNRYSRKDGHNPSGSQKEDFPTLQNQGSNYHETRIVYPSKKKHCEHHQARKQRNNENWYNRNPKFQNQPTYRREDQPTSSQNCSTYQNGEVKSQMNKSKMAYPSVEVAKLRKLEMSYAEVLKNALNRPYK